MTRQHKVIVRLFQRRFRARLGDDISQALLRISFVILCKRVKYLTNKIITFEVTIIFAADRFALVNANKAPRE